MYFPFCICIIYLFMLKLHFFDDCIELDIPNILSIFDVYLCNNDLNDMKESLTLSKKIYVKEIRVFEDKFYKRKK